MRWITAVLLAIHGLIHMMGFAKAKWCTTCEGDRHLNCCRLCMKGLKFMETLDPKVVYWHRELPPIDAEVLGEHTVEATSEHVTGSFAHGDEQWNQCYENLMAQAHIRLAQEVARLGGHYAHVLDESIDGRHNDATGQAWLHGRFTYVLYRRPEARN